MLAFSDSDIKEIAEQLECGFRCLVHKATGKQLFIPKEEDLDLINAEGWEEEVEELEHNFGDYIEVERPDSRDSFRVMEAFAESLPDHASVKQLLLASLGERKPFRHFKFVIDNSGSYREEWFRFRSEQMQEWVRERLAAAPRPPDEDDIVT